MISEGFPHTDSSTPQLRTHGRRPRFRRVRVALALLVLIGITTPHATSAPAEDQLLQPAGAVSTNPMFSGPPVIVLFGAAMLALAAALRRREGSDKARG